jgi:hypothetical protein
MIMARVGNIINKYRIVWFMLVLIAKKQVRVTRKVTKEASPFSLKPRFPNCARHTSAKGSQSQ